MIESKLFDVVLVKILNERTDAITTIFTLYNYVGIIRMMCSFGLLGKCISSKQSFGHQQDRQTKTVEI